MVASGPAAHGYQDINIDDGWDGARDAAGVLQPNAKFPDMKALTEYVQGPQGRHLLVAGRPHV